MADDIQSLNAQLANYGTVASYGDTLFTSGYSLVLPPLYDTPAVYAAPTNSNQVAAPADAVDNTGQSFLSYLGDVGKRLINAGADMVVANANRQNTNHVAPGAVPTVRQTEIIQGVPNLFVFAVAGFVLWKVVT